MNKSLPFQLTGLAVLALLLGAANNFRPSATIEWFRDWPPFSALAQQEANEDEKAPQTTDSPESSHEDELELAGTIPDLVVSNEGITDINLQTAHQIFRFAKDMTFWIDARSPELYEEGHIKGARLLYLYEKNTYLPEIDAEIQATQPISLVVYCKGKDCTDSHHLAQDLQAMGYYNIFVYKNGFDEWYAAGHEIEGSLAASPDPATSTASAPKTLEEKPPGMYLEHILRDLIPFIFGVCLLVGWKKTATSKGWVVTASIFLGLFFIYAAWPKVVNPLMFAKNIWNYDIAPAGMINLSALFLPALELVCGLCLIFGFWRRGSGLLVTGLLIIFILAVSFNVARGHEFNCGCTDGGTFISDVYFSGWNDKFTLILRDIGLLVMSVMAFKNLDRAKN